MNMTTLSLFKVWDHSRTSKKVVLAKTSLTDLLSKAKAKLNLEYSDLRLVLERDGTEVDEDEALLFVKDEVLMVLGPEQNWTKVEGGQPEQTVEDTNTNAAVPTSESAVAVVVKPTIDIPKFSDYVTQRLHAKESHLVWNKMIQEAAYYYLAHFPNVGIQNSSADYQEIGRKMLTSFPAISREGTNPWSFFTSALSQKIRRIRWDNKRKSQPSALADNTKSQKSHKRFRIELTPDTGDVDVKLYDEHVKELQTEMGKKNLDVGHVKSLLKATFKQRRVWIAQVPGGEVKSILEKFPCFKDARYIMNEFKMILNVSNLVPVVKQLEVMFETASQFMKNGSTADDAQILKFMESETSFKHGKGQKTKSLLQEVELTESVKLDTLLTSSAKSAPKLCAINRESQLVNLAIVADGVYLLLDCAEVMQALLVLVAFYYIMDLEYPRCYSQILGLVQHVSIQQPYDGFKTSSYVHFLKKLQVAMEKN